MKKTKVIINEERIFLQLCGRSYKDKIKKREKMTLTDFNRIYHVLMVLQMDHYAMYFGMELFPELLEQGVYESEKKRANEDMVSLAEDNLYAYTDLCQQYLYEFWCQMPLESQKKKYKELFCIDD